eukprot:1381690-Rhodomonas_salina.10
MSTSCADKSTLCRDQVDYCGLLRLQYVAVTLGALAVIFARVTPSSCACQSHHGPLCGFALHRVPHKVFAHKSP